MEVERPHEQPSTGGASSSSGPAPSGQEAVPLPSPSSHEVRMEVTEPSGSTRPLEGVMRARANEFGASRECCCLTRTTRLTGSVRSGGAHVSIKRLARQGRTTTVGIRSPRALMGTLLCAGRFQCLRHMNSVRAERLLAELDAEVHVKTPDPTSHTTYADAATRAATAVLAPVPSVRAVQVIHVHVVQNTIETPQLQILEKSVEFPATF